MGRWAGKYVIGLTGNIATGKSIVRKMLEHLGAFGLDADKLAQQAIMPGAPGFQPVVDTFGKWILAADGKINRAVLAKIVFTDPEALARLERITHPIVHQAIDILVQRNQRRVAVIEAIKLLEAGYGDEVDSVWVVDAPAEVRLQRLMARRNMSEAAARMYIQAQPPQQAKLDRADVVIDNGGSLESTWRVVQAAWNRLPVVAGQPAQPDMVTTVQVKPPAAGAPAVPRQMEIKEVVVTRGKPGNAEDIARVLSRFRGTEVSRMDVMTAFGEKAYLLAEANDQVVGGGRDAGREPDHARGRVLHPAHRAARAGHRGADKGRRGELADAGERSGLHLCQHADARIGDQHVCRVRLRAARAERHQGAGLARGGAGVDASEHPHPCQEAARRARAQAAVKRWIEVACGSVPCPCEADPGHRPCGGLGGPASPACGVDCARGRHGDYPRD
ncbi:MAG: dephospho-CoA kinase [Anaerolineae bacterium]|nr:dephospho-CoA kinase [Anaerolineae bacterium]